MGGQGEEGLTTTSEEDQEHQARRKRVRRKKKGRKRESGSELEQGKGEGEDGKPHEDKVTEEEKVKEKATHADKVTEKVEGTENDKVERPVRRFSVSPRSRKGSQLGHASAGGGSGEGEGGRPAENGKEGDGRPMEARPGERRRNPSPEKGRSEGDGRKSPEKGRNGEGEGRKSPEKGRNGEGGGRRSPEKGDGRPGETGGRLSERRLSKYEMFDQLRQHGIVEAGEGVDMIDTIMAQVRASNLKKKSKEQEEEDREEEDIEEVEGSGLTSASTTRGGRVVVGPVVGPGPKTVPGVHVGEGAPVLPSIPPGGEERGAGRGGRGRRARGGKVPGRKTRTEVKPKKEEATPTPVAAGAEDERIGSIEFQLPKTTAEFERQLAGMKHIPPAAEPPASRQRIPATPRLQPEPAGAALPPVVVTASGRPPTRHQFMAAYDRWADTDFYSDFKFTFVAMPAPRDALPCKCRLSGTPRINWEMFA